MSPNNTNKSSPLVYLLANSYWENINLRWCLKDMKITDVVSMVNSEHLFQELYHDPDIVMINAEINDPGAPQLIQQIKAHNPLTHIIFLIEYENHMDIIKLLRFGAFDYAVKDAYFTQKVNRILDTVMKLKQKINP